MNYPGELTEFLQLSARLGRDPLQIQASSGNTSIKLGEVLWIKASGKWLSRVMEEDSLVQLSLNEVRRGLEHGEGSFYTVTGSDTLRPSIETAMHAVLPHRVVIHTHSVSTIAWAVRTDCAERLADRLSGLRWQWISYMPSGLPLARAIGQALTSSPETDIFVLANHGLVIGGEDCESAERLLSLIETRLEVTPRCSAIQDQLVIDSLSVRILEAGFLFPCQAIFLGEWLKQQSPMSFILANQGDATLSQTQLAVLNGLLEVARRIPENAPVRYLSDAELEDLLKESYSYKRCAEIGAAKLARM